jgi:hypothetical protein
MAGLLVGDAGLSGLRTCALAVLIVGERHALRGFIASRPLLRSQGISLEIKQPLG